MSGDALKRRQYGKLRVRPEEVDAVNDEAGDDTRYDRYAHDNSTRGDGPLPYSQPHDSLDKSSEQLSTKLALPRKSKRLEEREASGKPPFRSQPPKKKDPPPPSKKPSSVALLRSTQRRLQAEAEEAASRPAQLRRGVVVKGDPGAEEEEEEDNNDNDNEEDREEEGVDEYIEEDTEEEEGDDPEPETPPSRSSRNHPKPTTRSHPRKPDHPEHHRTTRKREEVAAQPPQVASATQPALQTGVSNDNNTTLSRFFKTWYTFTFLGLGLISLAARITGNKKYDLFPQGSWYIQIFVLFTVSWIISAVLKTLFAVGCTLFTLLMTPVRIARGTVIYLAMAAVQPIRWLRGIDDSLEGNQAKTPKRANNSRAQAHANFHSKTAR